MVPVHAGAAGLLQIGLEPFRESYARSSFRGGDRPFHVGETPQLHVFAGCDGVLECPEHLQLCCRYELHIDLPEGPPSGVGQLARGDVLDPAAVGSHIRSLVPDGIGTDVYFVGTFRRSPAAPPGPPLSVAHMVVFRGVRRPIVREECDVLRDDVERAMERVCSLRPDKKGRMISKPIPYQLLRRRWEADGRNRLEGEGPGAGAESCYI